MQYIYQPPPVQQNIYRASTAVSSGYQGEKWQLILQYSHGALLKSKESPKCSKKLSLHLVHETKPFKQFYYSALSNITRVA